MRPGDPVEFWSGEGGGCWKPAVVAEWISFQADDLASLGRGGHEGGRLYVRLETGPGCWIIRKADLVRRVAPAGASSGAVGLGLSAAV